MRLNAENTRTLADAEAYRVGALMKIFEGVDTRVVQALAAAGMQPGQLIAQAFSGIAEKAERDRPAQHVAGPAAGADGKPGRRSPPMPAAMTARSCWSRAGRGSRT